MRSRYLVCLGIVGALVMAAAPEARAACSTAICVGGGSACTISGTNLSPLESRCNRVMFMTTGSPTLSEFSTRWKSASEFT